jgi:CBS domain-containing protein
MNLQGSNRGLTVDRWMTPMPKSLWLKPHDRALKALKLMQGHDVNILPVLGENGLVGAVTARYLEDYLYVNRVRH